MACQENAEQDWREIMASKASKWNKRSRHLSHLTISTHSPPHRSRSPVDDMSEVDLDDSSWSETESSVSTGFSRSVRSRATTLSVYSGMSCGSQDDLDVDGREEASIRSVDDDDDVSTTSEVPELLDDFFTTSLPSSQLKKWVEDDLAIRSFPTKHVDYLSHDWREVDIWASWRHLVSRKHYYNNEKRLENACWRVWGKKRSDLKTVTPESLNWLKDCDVTWLYGPLQPGPVESLRAMTLEVAPAPAAGERGREDMLKLKPILKRRSVSEKMLVRSLLSASLLKQATAAVEAERSSQARARPFRPLLDQEQYAPKSVRPTSPALSRSSSTASLNPLSTDVADKKRIHFQEQVEQCIALENSDSEFDSRGTSDLDTDREGEVIIMRRTRPRRETSSRTSKSTERISKIIAKLPSTTLNCGEGDADAELVASFWPGSKLSPPPSPPPQALSPSLSSTSFLLDIGDEDSIMGLNLNEDSGFRSPAFVADNDELSNMHRGQQLKDDLSFPCLVCNDLPDRVFGSRNDWLVHLWAVHQDAATWATTRCLWDGCKTQQEFESSKVWLDHVHDEHEGGMRMRTATASEADLQLYEISTKDANNNSLQGRPVPTGKVVDTLKMAKDIGSLIVHTAGDPLAATLEWLGKQYRASASVNGPNSEDNPIPTAGALRSNDTEYLRDLVQGNINKMSLNDDPARIIEQDRAQASLIGRLTELLSLRGEHTKHVIGNAEQDQSSKAATTVPALDDRREASARISALYSLLSSIRESLLLSKPASLIVSEGNGNSSESRQSSSARSTTKFASSETKVAEERQSIQFEVDEGGNTGDYSSDLEDLEDLECDSSADEELCDISTYDLTSHEHAVSTILNPIQQAMVDRIMDEFWVIFNREWDSGFTQSAGASSNSSTSSSSSALSNTGSSTNITTTPLSIRRKRSREDESPSDEEGDDEDSSKRPKRTAGPSENPSDRRKFACPFRKHDPRRYTTYSYRVCALSHWETIARVKEHIYRCHRMPTHCKRCWKSFKNQELLDTHLTVEISAMCELVPGRPPDGITTDQERRLRSRKKSSRNQSDEGRWREMYQLLFPNEEVPSPYFEPVQDEIPGSPDSRDLASYEDYMRRELPRLVRTNIEEVVRRDMQPLEAALIGNLVGIIQDCQDHLFRGYRQMRGTGTEATASPGIETSPFALPTTTVNSISVQTTPDPSQQSQFLDAIFQAPPLATQPESVLPPASVNYRGVTHPNPSFDATLSDSGYASEPQRFCMCPGPCTCSRMNSDSHSNALGIESNDTFIFEDANLENVEMDWGSWDPFPVWDSMNPVSEPFS